MQCRQQDENSRSLQAYLKETHELEASDNAIYCFFPANQCKNCFLYDASHISPGLNGHVIIITGFDSTNFNGFKHCYKDGDNTMLELPVLDYGNRIITFKDGIIKNAVPIRDLYTQLDSTAESISF